MVFPRQNVVSLVAAPACGVPLPAPLTFLPKP